MKPEARNNAVGWHWNTHTHTHTHNLNCIIQYNSTLTSTPSRGRNCYSLFRLKLISRSNAVDQVVACAPVPQRARVRSPVGTNFLGEVFRGFSSPVRQMSGSFRPTRSPNIIWLSLSSLIIHYGRQSPEMLTRSKISNIHRPTYLSLHHRYGCEVTSLPSIQGERSLIPDIILIYAFCS